MNAVIEMEKALRLYEGRCATLHAGTDVFNHCNKQAFELGFELAVLGVRLALLDMAVQGILPDTRIGRIMTDIISRLNASRDRALGTAEQSEATPLSGAGLSPPSG